MPVGRTFSALMLIAATAFLRAQAPAPDNSARQKLIETLDSIANQQLAERAAAIARIQTRAAAEKRKADVRQQILSLIGGLPEHRGPCRAF